MRHRVLGWDGCVNVRDLGGHPTEDGRQTRFGAIVRADSARQLSRRGWEAAVDYGIRTVVDLRFLTELEADPPADVPLRVVHVSLLGDGHASEWAEINAIADAQPDEVSSTRAVYLEFLERYRPRFGRAVGLIADAPPGGVLVHCQGGKDRTGLVVALVLRLARVGVAAIAADYATSADNLRLRLEPWIASAADDDERARRRRMSASPADAMVGVLSELEGRYGSVQGYLNAAGATHEQLERTAARLRG